MTGERAFVNKYYDIRNPLDPKDNNGELDCISKSQGVLFYRCEEKFLWEQELSFCLV